METIVEILGEGNADESSGEVLRKLKGGKNEVLLLEIEGEKKVFKPKDGTTVHRMKADRGGVKTDMYAAREILTYRIAHALGFNFVPVTVMASVTMLVPGHKTEVTRIGTLQSFVDGVTGAELKETLLMSAEEVQRTFTSHSRYLGLFEFFTGQMDRNTGNWIYVKNSTGSKIMLIDNAATFPVKVPRKYPLTPGWDLECVSTEIPELAKDKFLATRWRDIEEVLQAAELNDGDQVIDLAKQRHKMIDRAKHWYQLEQVRK